MVSILWPCCPGVPGLGDQGRDKGIFQKELPGWAGVCQGKAYLRVPGMEERGSAFSLAPPWERRSGEPSAGWSSPPPPALKESVRHLQKRPWPERKGTREGIPASRGEGVVPPGPAGVYPPQECREGTPAWVMEQRVVGGSEGGVKLKVKQLVSRNCWRCPWFTERSGPWPPGQGSKCGVRGRVCEAG